MAKWLTKGRENWRQFWRTSLRLYAKAFLADREALERAKNGARHWKTFVGVVIYALAQDAVLLLVSVTSLDGKEGPAQWGVMLAVATMSVFLWFYVSNGMIYMAARMFRGKGRFEEQLYLQSLMMVPVGIWSAIMVVLGNALFPSEPKVWKGVLVVFVIYLWMLQVRIVEVVHRLSIMRSILAAFLPFVVMSPCLCLALADWVLSGILGRML